MWSFPAKIWPEKKPKIITSQENPRAHKSKISTPPPPSKNPKFPPPPQNEDFYGHGGFPAERKQKFQAPIKLAHPFPAPELRTKILRTRGSFWTSHDVLESLKQALLASRDVIISGHVCSSKLLGIFTLGDGCWLPKSAQTSGTFRNPQPLVFSQKYCRYNWEVHCGTNRSRTAVQLGGVLRCLPFLKA